MYYLQLLVNIISSEEVTEELVTQTSKDTFNQEESKQIHIDEKNESVKINADVAVNVSDTVSINTTKVNCSSEKIYGPVEVL